MSEIQRGFEPIQAEKVETDVEKGTKFALDALSKFSTRKIIDAYQAGGDIEQNQLTSLLKTFERLVTIEDENLSGEDGAPAYNASLSEGSPASDTEIEEIYAAIRTLHSLKPEQLGNVVEYEDKDLMEVAKKLKAAINSDSDISQE